MRKHVLQSLSFAALAAALASTASAQGIITPMTPFNNPNLGSSVINVDASTPPQTIQSIEQIELRSIGGGVYRCVVTAAFIGITDTSLVSGTLVLAATPPLWLPDNDLDALNQPNASTDEFQGSLSADGLTFVWDNYVGVSAPAYPNVAVTSNTFICSRASTAVPFAVADVRSISGMPAGGVDPHIAQELANGNVVICFLDVNGNISKIEVDPATGLTSNGSVAATNIGQPNWVFSHSPNAQRDGSGAPRGLTFSEFTSSSNGSDGLWTEDLNDTGTPQIIAPHVQGGTSHWFANPGVVGGSFNWATATAGYGDPSQLEATCLVNTDATSGSGSLVAYAPIRPGSPAPLFFSGIFLGTPAPAPYQVPPVQGDITIFPFGSPVSGGHDPETGRLEFPLAVPAALLGTGPFAMQVITIDLLSGVILAGNQARLDF